MNELLPRELAIDLAERADLGAPQAIEPLSGGRNNRVYRVDLKGGKTALLKHYYSDPRDPRVRLQTEWNFLNYVRARGVRNVPQPLAKDPARHSALYSFVIGERPKSINSDLVRQAAEFTVGINQAPQEAEHLAAASEACFSLNDHLETVDHRVARLRELDPGVPHVDAVRAFVESRLTTMWEEVKSLVVRQAAKRSVSLAKPIREVVSPSDFGFHNALIDRHGGATFLDFEYAGRDDPAKLICDFFCQPEFSIPASHYSDFTGYLVRSIGLQEEDLWRAQLLLNAYRIKWVCIMLNDFSPMDARRRAFSIHNSDANAARQLRNAECYFDLISCPAGDR
jgi:hypothetical protein